MSPNRFATQPRKTEKGKRKSAQLLVIEGRREQLSYLVSILRARSRDTHEFSFLILQPRTETRKKGDWVQSTYSSRLPRGAKCLSLWVGWLGAGSGRVSSESAGRQAFPFRACGDLQNSRWAANRRALAETLNWDSYSLRVN